MFSEPHVTGIEGPVLVGKEERRKKDQEDGGVMATTCNHKALGLFEPKASRIIHLLHNLIKLWLNIILFLKGSFFSVLKSKCNLF